MKRYFIVFSLFILALILNSCLGFNMDIHLKRDGSGRIAMEYQIPSMLENLGQLDGNQNMPPIPLNRADFENTVSHIKGVKIISFNSSKRGQDNIIKVTLEFNNIEALAEIIGESASYSDNTLNILILEDDELSKTDRDIIELMRYFSDDKKFSLNFTKDGANSTLSLTDGNGNTIPAPASVKIVPNGKNVSFDIDTMDLFEFYDGLGIKIDF